MDLVTLALANKYTDNTADGLGAVKGAPCTIKSIEKTEDGNKLTFEWTSNSGTKETSTIELLDGTNGLNGEDGNDGIGIKTATVKENGELVLTLTNDNIINAGIVKGERGEQGIRGERGEQGAQGVQGVQGIQGEKGEDGYPFLIYKQYEIGIEEFNEADFPEIGLMFMIHVWEENKGYPIYRYTADGTDTPYTLITYMNTEGIKGEKGEQGIQGVQGVDGRDGKDGITYVPRIGTVNTVEHDVSTSVTLDIDEENAIATFNFDISKPKDAITFIPEIGTVETTNDVEANVTLDVDEENAIARYNFTLPTPVENYSPAPIGTVLSFAGSVAPNGYLICNGQSVLVSEYQDLYDVIGNTYGGDSTKFNVPNLVNKFIQGSTSSGTEKEAGLPNIEGTFGYSSVVATIDKHTTGAFVPIHEANANNIAIDTASSDFANKVGLDASKFNAIYGNSDTVQPPALTMIYIIKAKHTNEGTDTTVELTDDVINYVDNKIGTNINKTVFNYTNTTNWSIPNTNLENFYVVKNGWCFLNIVARCNKVANDENSIVFNGLPKAPFQVYGKFVGDTLDMQPCNLTITPDGKMLLRGGTAGKDYSFTYTYPVI